MVRIEDKRSDKAAAFAQRMNRVLDFIDTHLPETEPLRLEALASVAAFSPFHFHRIFRAWTGETLQDFIRHRRLEKAGGQLVHNPTTTIQTVAQHCGFTSAEAFSRAFSQHFGMNPSAWRAGGYRHWDPVQGRARGDRPCAGLDVRMRCEPARTVAYFRVVGDYRETAEAAWKQCLAWVTEHKLETQARFGMALDDPQITPPSRCRYDACVLLPEGWEPRGERVSRKRIEGGLYACLAYSGAPSGIGAAWLSMLGEWLPNSGHCLSEEPFVEVYAPHVVPNADSVAVELCMPLSD
ncbi:GyrI-like domain-containing protein [Niveibacterium umoris]|uniref:AraC family transcriptional regulator n=1 Tax=Niveibacterium umoris TaxID=1193620 RepID=A0A840BJP1_9RHOO|nr:GyrI-like domain-containing protein [Niveibacterium umoris]MBB4012843.1 AraC family transcriptional regulator [Niveibacterium umoris]